MTFDTGAPPKKGVATMVEFKNEEGNLVCAFSGKLDTVVCMKFEKDILEQVHAATGAVAFDLAEVNFIASMFLRLCIQVCKDAGANRFEIVHSNDAVLKVFKLAGFDKQMRIS
jgi:anti-anti-sigma factor